MSTDISPKTRKISYLMLLITMILWGGSWPMADVMVNSAPPFTIGFFRFLVASILFLIASIFTKEEKRMITDLKNQKWVFALGLTGIFGYGTFFLFGLSFTTSAQGAIIAGSNPVFITLFAYIIHKERLEKKWKYWGLPISFLGVLFVIGIQAFFNYEPDHLKGNILIVLAMATWGTYSNLGKQVMKKYSAQQVTLGATLYGMILFGIAALIFERDLWSTDIFSPGFIWGVLYLGGLVTFIGFQFYFRSIRNIGATSSAIFINLVPIFGVLLSYIFLQETIYTSFIIGLSLIISGILVINYPLSIKTN